MKMTYSLYENNLQGSLVGELRDAEEF